MFSAEQQPPSHPPRSALRSILPYTTILTLMAALYVAWIMYSRYAASRDDARKAQEAATTAERQRNLAITQHGQLSFTTFYASNATVVPGQSTQLCYGVINAKAVRIEPSIEQLRPTERHCMDIAPKRTTTYTITADDGAGQSKSLSLTVKVRE